MMKNISRLLVQAIVLILCVQYADTHATARIPQWTHNLLLDAKVSGNLKSYQKGLRGAPDHMIYDLQRHRFVKASRWHEYGVGFGQDLGVVPENRPAWWMARWPQPIQANLIVLSGVYDNQPQPKTAWKIELRTGDKWLTHARGVGGWYDKGRYTWGGPATKPIRFDAIRISVFSKNDNTPLKSIHFRGEEGVSWVIAYCPPIDVELRLPRRPIRAGTPARFDATPLLGKIQAWSWEFGDGEKASGKSVTHAFDSTGTFEVALEFSDGKNTGKLRRTITVVPPIEARITPLTGPVLVGKSVTFGAGDSIGKITDYEWDFGDGEGGSGRQTRHTYDDAGIYKVKLTVSDDRYEDEGLAIVRAHTEKTLHVPQAFLDTDQKNEQDDQHYFGYALFSELDILGINSVHHGGGQEPINYEEILHILNLARKSGLPEHRVPFVFRGANQPLEVPRSGDWRDTTPALSQASEAILAAARGASPSNPVWVVPVGPGTNAASAILQARTENLELKDRMRVMWLGGSNNEIINEFNGNNDPWSMYVVTHSGLETWIMPAPVGARVRIDKRSEGHLYADHPLGQYLKKIVPAHNKALFDPSCLAAIISQRLQLGWIKQTEPVLVAGPKKGYRWSTTDDPTTVRVIRQIDQKAMQLDIFNTMKGEKRRLIGAPVN
jgi:hypothetical protein